MKLKQFDVVEATFSPQRTEDLKPGISEWIGKRGYWEAAWVIEEGRYKDMWAMQTRDYSFPAAWVPECDLSDVRKKMKRHENLEIKEAFGND